MEKEKLDELNIDIRKKQEELLRDRQVHSEAILTYDIALNTKLNQLQEIYAENKNKDYSNDAKRRVVANDDGVINKHLKDCGVLDNNIRLKEIELSFMKRQFYIHIGSVITIN